jgi:hypothetical protein
VSAKTDTEKFRASRFEPDTDESRRHEQRAQPVRQLCLAAAAEATHGPATVLGDRQQLLVRIQWSRIADAFEQLKVVIAVRIEKTLLEVGAMRFRQRFGCSDLTRSETGGAYDRAGKHAFFYFEPRAEYVLDVEIACGRLDLVRRRRRDDCDRVPLAKMGVDERS